MILKKKIKKCLCNNDGSSLMIAIVVLLVCVVLGGIVISAASVNMTRVNRNSQEHQAYLTAESTALMFRELVKNQKMKIQPGADGSMEVTPAQEDESVQMLTELLVKDMDALLTTSGDEHSGGAETAEPVHTLELEEATEKPLAEQKVQADWKMNGGYGLELRIRVSLDGKPLSQLYLELPAVLDTQNGVTFVTWSSGTITRLDTTGEGSGAG